MNNCSHIDTITQDNGGEDATTCLKCNKTWSEQEWTDMKENEEIIADEMIMAALGK